MGMGDDYVATSIYIILSDNVGAQNRRDVQLRTAETGE